MDFLNFGFNTVLYTNYVFLGLIAAMIAFIFLRRLFLYPIKYLEQERFDFYLKRVNGLLKKEEIKKNDVRRELATVSHYDKLALEAVLLKKLDELYVGPSIKNTLLARPQKKKLTFLFDESGLTDWRIEQLKSPRVWTRRRAADILGRSGTRRAIVPFIIGLRDGDEDVRLICAKGLGKLKARRSVPFLISVLDDCDPRKCPMLADILIDFGRFSIPPVIAALSTDNAQKLHWLLRALAEIEFPEGRSRSDDYIALKNRLVRLVRHRDESVRAHAAVCLGKLRQKEAYEHVCPLLKDKSPFVRARVTDALAEIRSEECVPPLIRLLGDPVWNVNFAATRALMEFGPGISPRLKARLKDGNAMRRKRCAEILEEFEWIMT